MCFLSVMTGAEAAPLYSAGRLAEDEAVVVLHHITPVGLGTDAFLVSMSRNLSWDGVSQCHGAMLMWLCRL
jgi:hypothetical protein